MDKERIKEITERAIGMGKEDVRYLFFYMLGTLEASNDLHDTFEIKKYFELVEKQMDERGIKNEPSSSN